ncbi:ABC-2 transporter permease [Bacillus sp. B1-b2]|uniref:ABC-2 transporter permease n=1 Tax=Bacillus sp. B1-b2 TaxID=2653201 RepID=UPI001261ECF7|nr:ABC-2 transporter permease [Bacillus sp. B1-b2]KAB7672198.1 ABC-2 transporter permease [Bacillus sp. B1-b2]
MKGLLLTSYYLVYRTFFTYIGIAIVVSLFIFYFGDNSMHRIAAMLIILFSSLPALEVLKIESKSGYDKYVLTLPVSRTKIVKSHYYFYFIVAAIGALLSYGVFQIYGLVTDAPINNIFSIISFGIFIVLFAGSLVYPLIYILGTEKSDVIVLGGGMGGLLTTFGLQTLIQLVVERLSLTNVDAVSTIYIPVIYILCGIILYFASFFVARIIYLNKEF